MNSASRDLLVYRQCKTTMWRHLPTILAMKDTVYDTIDDAAALLLEVKVWVPPPWVPPQISPWVPCSMLMAVTTDFSVITYIQIFLLLQFYLRASM